MVYLVGAGPGDPELITHKGLLCLGQADLVLYDYLVNPQLLTHARQAEKICLGRHGQGRILSQDEINARMIEAARAGKNVVRLKSGDPMIYGRAGEELQALVDAGIQFEIVPGVTAAAALGAYAGIPITHRDHSSAVAFVTGHESEEKDDSALDYAELARFPGTLIFYMGITTARHWSSALISGGRPPNTPVAIVRRCSWNDQQVVRCTLENVADVILEKRLRPPALIVVGGVAHTQTAIDWFSSRPLFGRTVLIARAEEQAEELRSRLEKLGAEVVSHPVIRIGEPIDWKPVDRAIERLAEFDWVVFLSRNGVTRFLHRLLRSGDVRQFGAARIAAIGPSTTNALASYHLQTELIPSEFRAESLADELAPRVKGKRVLILRASRGREVLAERLEAAGATVEQVVVYTSADVETPDPDTVELFRKGSIDFVVVSSSAIATSLVRLFGDHLRTAKLASISPITSETLVRLGHPPATEAKVYALDGVVEAILNDAGRS